MKEKQNKIFILVLIFILSSVLCWFLIKHVLISKGFLELQTTSNWIYYESTETSVLGKINDFIEEKKTNLQNRVTNYFPFYLGLNKLFYHQVISTNKLIYQDDFPINYNGDGEYIFYNDEYDFYYVRINRNEVDLSNRVIQQSDFFNSLYKSNPDISLNIYIVPGYQQTKLADNNLNKYIDEFKNNLNKNINVSELKIESNEDYIKKFYKTDHHWNIYGAYQGYKDISNMMGNNPLNLNINQISPVKYYGSYAKNSLSTLTYDHLYDVENNLTYEVEINSKYYNKFKPRKITYNKGFEFFDYYIHYFDGQCGLVKYSYENDSEENLLIFSDSYAWQIDYLLASHYKNTYVVNLRYDDYANGTFNYNEFVKEHNISDVLFLYMGTTTVFDQYDYNFDNKIVRDK